MRDHEYHHVAVHEYRRNSRSQTLRKSMLIGVAFLVLTGSLASAQQRAIAAPNDTLARTALVYGMEEIHYQLVIPKDPVLASILSAGVPGLGQVYVGKWVRGLAFFGSSAAGLIAAGIAGNDLTLTVSDYDDPSRGGNGDGIVNTDEYERWEDNPTGDFGDLSTARQTIVFAGLATTVGLYAWNVIDAYRTANNHNRRMYSQLTGVQVGVMTRPDGRVLANLSIPLR